jgi:flagellar assembly protein FliH
MSDNEKFLFDTVFNKEGDIVRASEPKRQKRSFTPDEVEEIRQAAHAEGMASAEAEAVRQSAAALEQLAQTLGAITATAQQEIDRIQADAAQLALMIAQKLAGNALNEQPEHAIEALIVHCLQALPSEPHMVVRVDDTLSDGIRARLDPLVKRTGFEGKIMVFGEPERTRADCRIEWTDGGIERDFATAATAIEAAIERFITATGEPQGDLFQNGDPTAQPAA